jgi:hypothetical protein
MEINMKPVFTLLLASLMSGCYFVIDDGGYDSYDSYDSYDTHYGSVPWIDTGSTYWYCEEYREYGEWNQYYEFYTIAADDDGSEDIRSIKFYAYYYDGYQAFEGDLIDQARFGGLEDSYGTSRTFYYDNFPCDDIYEVEFYVEDWDGNYTSYWLY